jgi:hypothetical protein
VVGTSALAVIAAIGLLLAGLVWLLGGGTIVLVATAIEDFLEQSDVVGDLAQIVRSIALIAGIVALVVGFFHVIASFGIFRHRGWGRAIGLLVSLLATLLALLAVAGSVAGTQTLNDGTVIDASQNMGPSVGTAVFYGLIFLFLLIGGRHFRRGVRFE